MDVPPHPHTGLATVSWLFTGEVEHRDSLGTHAMVRPGELNLMTGGHGVAHSEVSTPDTTRLHGVQLWVALPEDARDPPRDFAHHVPETTELDGAVARVFLGTLAGSTSRWPRRPRCSARSCSSSRVPSWGSPSTRPSSTVCSSTAARHAQGRPVERAELVSSTRARRRWRSTPADEPPASCCSAAPPFGEQIVMWWNFVGRTHDEIVAFRAGWEAGSERFGTVDGYVGRDGRRGAAARLPAPALPHATIRPRGNPR